MKGCDMKIFSVFILMVISSLSVHAAKNEVVKASDSAVDYVGRVKKYADGSVSYDWAGVYLRTRFTGTSVAIDAEDTAFEEYNVFIDGKQVSVVSFDKKRTRMVLAKGLTKGEHTLMFQKRNEGMTGRFTIHSFLLDKDAMLLPVVSRPQRLIEFVGNSITCGYGTESTEIDHPYDPRTADSNHGYGPIIARYFDADYMLTSHSGQGIVKNWDDTVTMSNVCMLHRYTRLFDEGEEQWDFSVKPSLVCISLGTNDYSQAPKPSEAEFTGAYRQWLHIVREKYGDVPVLFIAPLAGEPSRTYMKRLVDSLSVNDKNVYYMALYEEMMEEEPDLGPVRHPTYSGHRKMAMCIIPYISKIMKWGLPVKPIE